MALMRFLVLFFIALFGLFPASVHAQAPGSWEAPTRGGDRDVIFVEMSVWSTQGPPVITANIMGEQQSQKARLTDVGVYSATFKVPYGRLLPVELRIGNGPVTEDLIVLHHRDHRVSWVLEENGDFLRSSSPVSRESMAIQEAMILTGGILWIVIVGIVLISGRLERSDTKVVSWRLPEPIWLIFWIGLSIAWTWPSALSDNTMVVGRHFDTVGTLWVIGSAMRLFSQVDMLTAWPIGADLTRLDSYLLVPVSTVLANLGPGRIFGWLSIVGVALNAWSAQHFARAVGARSPWTLLAGIGFGFCGMAATGLLEGHIYQVFNPWLPWFGAVLWKATAADGTRRQVVLALGLFVLCWLTTAYVGVVALGMAIALMVMSERRPVGLILGGISFLAFYVLWYTHGDAPARETLEGLNPMSAHMAGLLAATPEIDRVEHSMAPIVFGWMLGLVLLGWHVLGKGRWRALLYAGVASILLSMIPGFAASPDLVLIPANLDWVPAPIAGFLRFPIRWAWLWSLCGGVLASVVATRMAPRWGRWGWAVLLIAIIEAFVRIGTPYRQEVRFIESPAKLTNHEGGVLELLPITENRGNNWDRWLANFSCLEQLNHNQPIAEDCVHTKPRKIRQQLNVWLQDRLLREDMEGAEATLAALNFRTVMLKPDLFTTRHASRMEVELKKIDAHPDVLNEKGIHAIVFTVTGSANQNIDAMLRNLKPPQQPRVSRRNWMGPAHHGYFNGYVALGGWFVIFVVLGLGLRRRCKDD